MTKMPPQAYTKEVLATAFDWLSRQNESVKKSIRNSDDLVGLYLRSTRLKDGGSQTSVPNTSGYSPDLSSAKSFRSELQGLAQNLKQFEEKPALPPELKVEPDYMHELSLMMSTQSAPQSQNSQGFAPTSLLQAAGIQNVQAPKPTVEFQQPAATAQKTAPQNIQNNDEQYMTATKENTTAVETADTVLLKLDKKTISAINLAKERLNLSSNTEAIRVLVSLGEKHLKKIFGTEE